MGEGGEVGMGGGGGGGGGVAVGLGGGGGEGGGGGSVLLVASKLRGHSRLHQCSCCVLHCELSTLLVWFGVVAVCWLLHVWAACQCISDRDLCRQVVGNATLITLSISLSQRMLTPGQPVPAMPGAWQKGPLVYHFVSHWYDSTWKKDAR